jgi:hypothetical protein
VKINWGTGIVIFFIVFISLAIGFIVFSLRQEHDLVDEDYYRKGAEYSVQIAINQRSENYMDSVRVFVTGDFVQVDLCISLLQNIDSLHLVFYRPSDKDLDYSFSSKIVDSSGIKVPKSKLVNGRYLVKLSWMLQGNKYMLQKQLFIN